MAKTWALTRALNIVDIGFSYVELIKAFISLMQFGCSTSISSGVTLFRLKVSGLFHALLLVAGKSPLPTVKGNGPSVWNIIVPLHNHFAPSVWIVKHEEGIKSSKFFFAFQTPKVIQSEQGTNFTSAKVCQSSQAAKNPAQHLQCSPSWESGSTEEVSPNF